MLGPDGYLDLTGAWKGATAVLVASGPSLDLEQVHRIGRARVSGAAKVVAVNDAMYPCHFADLGYACDRRWWLHHGGMRTFAGMRVRMIATDKDREPHSDLEGILTVGFSGTDGFDERGGYLRSGGHSGYQALHLAIHAGAARIILVGYDCGAPLVGQGHFFGEHPKEIRSTPNRSQWAKRYAALRDVAAARGIHVVNATPSSAIDVFERRALRDVLP